VTGPLARLATAVVTLAAATALLAGCGSGGSAKAQHTAPAEQPAASAPGIGPDGTTEPSATPGGEHAATLPKSQLTPATGTFTDRQKEYLVGKVPQGMDPSAVLQTGQESCERIADTADASRTVAEQAIASGEITDAKDAITYLCPQYKNLLP
jgi:hypothetical protein